MQFFAEIPNGAWTVVPGIGCVGLRPEALRDVRETLGISVEQWRLWFRDVQVMEAASLSQMNKR